MIKRTPIKKVGRKHQERIKAGLSETTTFLIKRNRNRGYSDLSHTFFSKETLASYQFAHALPKGTYPEFRNNPNNIVFVDSIEQHERVDRTIAGKKFLVEQLVMHGELIPRLQSQWEFYCNRK